METAKPTTIRKIEVRVPSRIGFADLRYLLKEGKLNEYVEAKENRLKEWKEKRYRICLNCGEKKLRSMFNGASKECRFCKGHKKKESNDNRREYFKDYIRNGGLENWCSKQIVYNLKKMGLIKKEPCLECGNEKSYAHHKDYNKPWEVVWLCSKHHNQWHKTNKPIYVRK